jgi:hypothetical protein
MIVKDDQPHNLERLLPSVQKVGSVYHPDSMPCEHFDIFYCRGLKEPLKQLWPQVKNRD